jgi:hypothetical protein
MPSFIWEAHSMRWWETDTLSEIWTTKHKKYTANMYVHLPNDASSNDCPYCDKHNKIRVE